MKIQSLPKLRFAAFLRDTTHHLPMEQAEMAERIPREQIGKSVVAEVVKLQTNRITSVSE